ncbi:hypothetical protein ACWN8V_06795 [Vagococcus elongatus]|uniref:Uncharacterized protein n=1 Tax=Vagococcus elongatus TaxID=180344 RepID=A0A430AW10_9ENTE|nr:hypothetical protein [Vagococcus elongatus]RSU12241.1 hypothetical protein CBF29_06485 [Vagococcus elongatus]
MLKIFTSGRAEGKTTRVIKEAALRGVPILVSDHQQQKFIYEQAEMMGLNIEVVTYNDVKKGSLKGSSKSRLETEVYVDNIELLLAQVLDVPVAGFTVNSELGSIEFLGVTQSSLLNAHKANSLLVVKNGELKNTVTHLKLQRQSFIRENKSLDTSVRYKNKDIAELKSKLEKLEKENNRLKETDTFWKWLRSKFVKNSKSSEGDSGASSKPKGVIIHK